MSKGVAVGLKDLYYAELITDVVGGAATYGTPVRIPGAIQATFSPNATNDTLFADDGPYDAASSFGAMSLELNVADLTAEVREALLGAKVNAAGVLVQTSNDTPPYVAVGMSIAKSNGKNRLIWYLKGKFTAPDDNNQTKGDSINWNTPSITGNFLKRDCDDKWRLSVDTDDAGVTPSIITAWFTSPNADVVAGG